MIRESESRDPLSESVRSRRGEAPPLSESARTDPGADSDRGREPTRTEADSDRFKFRPGGHRWRVAGPKIESTAVPKLAEETAESAGGKGGPSETGPASHYSCEQGGSAGVQVSA